MTETIQAAALSIKTAPAPGEGDDRSWIHVLPVGTFTGVDGRGPWRVGDLSLVIENSRRYAGRRKMLVDYEHQSIRSEQNGQPAPAAGWIVGMRAAADGIWALVEWTEKARDHIAKREYRYLSPVIAHTRDGKVTHIVNVALTNEPNLDTLTSLSRAEDTTMSKSASARSVDLAKALNLSEDSDPASIIAELRRMTDELAVVVGHSPEDRTTTPQSESAPDPAQFVPIGDFERVVGELNTLRQGVSKQAAEAHVGDQIRNGRLAPFLKEWAVTLCTANKPAFDAFIDRTGTTFAHLFQPMTSQFRADRIPGSKTTLSDGDDRVRQLMGLTAEEFAKGRDR